MQTGSAFILMGSLAGAVPSSIAIPVTLPAVAVSTFCPAGAADGDDGFSDVLCSPPPHAATDAAIAKPRVYCQMFRRRIDLSSL